MKNQQKLFGNYIRFKRKSLGMTLPKLALESGLSKGVLSKIENGDGNPCLKTIVLLSKALKVSCGQMLSVSFNELK